jgi:hypothetical protein
MWFYKFEAKKNIQKGKQSRKSKDRHFNHQKKQNEKTNNDLQNTTQKTIYLTTLTHLNPEG